MHDHDIEAVACGLRHAFVAAQNADGIAVVCPPICPETLVYEFLDGRDRLSLDLETPLGADENGYPIAGRMRVADDGDGGLIHIDCDVAATALYPFTLAHEIGHWILHRQHILRARAQLSLFDTRPMQTQTLHRNLEGVKTKLPPEEWQANRFAVHLLLPADLVKKEFFLRYNEPINHRDGKKHENLPALFGQLRDCSRFVAGCPHRQVTQQVNSPLYEHFGVSREAMAIRLEELQLITNNLAQPSEKLFDA